MGCSLSSLSCFAQCYIASGETVYVSAVNEFHVQENLVNKVTLAHITLSGGNTQSINGIGTIGNLVSDRIELLLAHPTARPIRWSVTSVSGAFIGSGNFDVMDGQVQYARTVKGMRSAGLYLLLVDMDNGERYRLREIRN